MKKLRTGALILTTSVLLTSCWFKSDKKEENRKEKIDITAFEENDKKRSKYKGYTVEEVYINGKLEKIDVQNHGDHYHIIFKNKKYELTSEQFKKLFNKDNKITLKELEEINIANLTSDEIISYEKHGDHWHIKTKNGEFITYQDPSKLKTLKEFEKSSVHTLSKNDFNKISIKSYYKHGDHWHIITNDGKEYISYENPYGKTDINTISKKVESVVIEHKDNYLFEKVIDHGDHVHVWINGKEVVLSKSDYEKSLNENKLIKNEQEHHHNETTHTDNSLFEKVIDHGDHVHVWINGREVVLSKSDYEKSLNENKLIKNEHEHHHNETTHTDNSLFEKVIDHGDHIHVWVKGEEYSISRELYDEFVKNNYFDEIKASGKHGETYEFADEKTKREIEYISKVYGVPIETIKFSKERFSFPAPEHEYDPTHIHPYFIPRNRFIIPEVTGIPELDFENELLALSNRTGLSPNKIIVRDGKFVLSHGDHDHYVNILSTGYDDYIKNKLPDIEGKKIVGPLDKTVVENKVDKLLKQIDELYTDPILNRRRKRVLIEFKEKINENINSTDGYLKMLDEFDKLYVNVVEGTEKTELDELTNRYNELIKKINSKDDKFFTEIRTTRDEFIKIISSNSSSEDSMYKMEFTFKEMDRFSGRYAIVAMGYIDYMSSNIESNLLSPQLKEEISQIIIELQNNGFSGFNRPQAWILRLIDINLKLTKELANGIEHQYTEEMPTYNKLIEEKILEKTKNFVEEVKDFAFPIETPDVNKYN